MIKNAFYFILKPLFVLKIFNFFPDILSHVGKRLDKKAKANFKIYDVIKWEKIFTKRILPNIPRSKDN